MIQPSVLLSKGHFYIFISQLLLSRKAHTKNSSNVSKKVVPLLCGRRNFKDTNPLMSSSLVILFGVVKQFGRF
jgi:hypothetical protein